MEHRLRENDSFWGESASVVKINFNNRRGSILLFVLLSTAIMTLVISFVTGSWQSQLNFVLRDVAKLQAYWLALGWEEVALSDIKKKISRVANTSYEKFKVPFSREAAELEEFLNIVDLHRVVHWTYETEEVDMAWHLKTKVSFNYTKPESEFAVKWMLKKRVDLYPDAIRVYATKKMPLAGYRAVAVTQIHLWEKRYNFKFSLYKPVSVRALQPVAPKYVLFIAGTQRDVLKYGTFIVSNGMSRVAPIRQEYINMIMSQLPKAATLHDKLIVIRNLLAKIKPQVKEEEDMSLIFKAYLKSGRVRTNGELDVYLPFFDIDDIINYFVKDPRWDKPEVGYIGCHNRLHDRFMYWATRYEGKIFKYYYVLPPVYANLSGPIEKYMMPRHDLYTPWTTFKNYPVKHPDEFDPRNLITYLSPQNADVRVNGDIELRGSFNEPFQIDGFIYVKGDAVLDGYYSGKGVLCVDNAYIGDLKPADPSSAMVLVVRDGIRLIRDAGSIKASIYSKNSIRGRIRLNIYGNLVVQKLNRYDNKGKFYMPRIVFINYDSRFRREISWVVLYAKPTHRWIEFKAG